MKLERTQLLAVLSQALDCVEKELIGVTDHHAKRVAMLCVRMAEHLGMAQEERGVLAVNALLHDSALNEHRDYYHCGCATGEALRGHCVVGEENLSYIPGDVSRDFVLYHHECADGSGPFGKTADQTPLGAQLLHIADQLDRSFPVGNTREEELKAFVAASRGTLFAAPVCDAMEAVLSRGFLDELADEKIENAVLNVPEEYYETDLRALSGLFARIIDYKSTFTKEHSIGLAEKAERMARYYGWDEETVELICCAGALHDIGKLMVERNVLEKPGRLDQREYQHIQSHAYETYRLLSQLDGMQQLTQWASNHHEKLNGQGYPFGLTGEKLDEKSRLLACLDIYQALTEDRPYKAGMTHSKAVSILRELVEKGELDGNITEDIARVFHREGFEIPDTHTALFQCNVCGHIYEGDTIPEHYICPVCGQKETAFVRLR